MVKFLPLEVYYIEFHERIKVPFTACKILYKFWSYLNLKNV